MILTVRGGIAILFKAILKSYNFHTRKYKTEGSAIKKEQTSHSFQVLKFNYPFNKDKT